LIDTIPKSARLVVEVGSWLGRSTRFLADLIPQAHIVAIDHWQGSPEHLRDPELAAFLPRLYETFLAESWDYRERIIPVRAPSTDGLRLVADAGLKPDLVYLDADHSAESVRADLTAILDLFPGVRIVGDDWDWASVREGVDSVAGERGILVQVYNTAWRIVP
jgi:predicted O-methyltransferase YrrM